MDNSHNFIEEGEKESEVREVTIRTRREGAIIGGRSHS